MNRRNNNNNNVHTKSSLATSNTVLCLMILLFLVSSITFFQSINHNNNNSYKKLSSQLRIYNNTVIIKNNNEIIKNNNEIIIKNNNINNNNNKKRIAYAITITKDGSFQDGAAVLAYSILHHSKSSLLYDISLIAFVHPIVSNNSKKLLNNLGYHVIESIVPINSSAIKFKWFREHIDKNGCCGSSELIKLNSYRLLNYYRVVHLDADVILLNSIEELFNLNYSLIYTTDPNMASHKGEDKLPVQGGFIIIQPNLNDYYNLINLIMTVEFRSGSAWNGTKIGWFWGGMTVQGILPYYYNLITEPNRSYKVNRCIYNTMVDVPECKVQHINELKSAHFTVCQKPWGCFKYYDSPLCGNLHEEWFRLRKLTEEYYSMTIENNPCPQPGHKHYKAMKINDAIKRNETYVQIDYNNPDILYPIGNHGYDIYQY